MIWCGVRAVVLHRQRQCVRATIVAGQSDRYRRSCCGDRSNHASRKTRDDASRINGASNIRGSHGLHDQSQRHRSFHRCRRRHTAALGAARHVGNDRHEIRFGCGIAACGACTVHVDGIATRSCVTSIDSVGGAAITTIEGLSSDRGNKVQQAWIAEDVPQCGYCQSGMIMAAAALLAKTPKPTDAEIDEAITNICRCGTYNRVRTAIHRAAAL